MDLAKTQNQLGNLVEQTMFHTYKMGFFSELVFNSAITHWPSSRKEELAKFGYRSEVPLRGIFFFFQFCDDKLAIISKRKLAKFAYRSKRKGETFKHPTIFWQPAGKLLSTYGNSRKKNSSKFGNLLETYCLHMAIPEKKIP
jgi:hypothetical protein